MRTSTPAALKTTAFLLVTTLSLLGATWQPSAYPFDPVGSHVPATHFIHLKAGTFDPLAQGSGWVPSAYRLVASEPSGDFVIVQLHDLVRGGQLDILRGTGATYRSYLPDNAFLMWANAFQVRELRALSIVRSVTPFEPFFRLHEDLRAPGFDQAPGRVQIIVEILKTPDRLDRWVAERGGTVIEPMALATYLEVPRSMVREIAAQPDVAWVQPYYPRELLNQNSAWILGARTFSDGPFNASTNRLWSYNDVTGLFEGTTGKGVNVTVADTGIDVTHPAFEGKIIFVDGMGQATPNDEGGHGTHTSGTVLGTGAWRYNETNATYPGKYAGLAPDAMLVMEDWTGPNASIDNVKFGITNARYNVQLSSNSWGGGSGYDDGSRTYDILTRDSWPDDGGIPASVGPQPVLYFFSAGNGGGNKTIGSPAHAKNVVTIGATGDNFRGIPYEEVSSFSSRGPTADGRIKPDLMAPGSYVRSALALGASFEDLEGISYGSASGTSMSCPGAAGAAAVAWQWYREHVGAEPTPAMMKAILINGAQEMTNYAVLGADQGFGRINLPLALFETPTREQVWQPEGEGLSTDQEHVYVFAASGGQEPLAMTIVWSDVPGDTSAATALVNDLDTWVLAPDGKTYRGNVMDSSGNSLAGGQDDQKNNVEKLKFPTPSRGFYELHVKGKNVPAGPQSYALAVRGQFVYDQYDIALDSISANATSPVEGQAVTLNMSVRNPGTQWVNGSTLTVEAQTAQGRLPVGTQVLGPIAPKEISNFSMEWTTIRGNVTFFARVEPPLGQNEFSIFNDARNTSIFVRGYGFNLGSNALPSYQLNPTGSVVVRFDVTQTGNTRDNISLALAIEGAPFDAQINNTLIANLTPGRTAPFQVNVTVPAWAKASDRMNLSIFAQSLGDGRWTASASTYVTVNHLYAFTVGAVPNHAGLPPGGVDYAQVTVRNDGNGPDTFALSTVGLPEGWNFTFEQPTVTVADNETAGVRVKIEAPARADAGSTFGFLVRVASDGAPPQVLDFTLNVTQVYGLTVDIVAPQGEVAAGSLVEVPINAQNIGNGVDDVVIEIRGPPNWITALTRSRLALLPYSNLTSTARITVDRSALAGNYSFNLSFSGANINTARRFNITVQQVYILEVNGPETTLRMDQGQTILIDVNVTNLGNGPAKVTPAAATPEGLTLIASENFLVIDANGTAQFSFQLVAIRSMAAGLYNFTVDFKTGATGNRSNPLTVRVDVRAVQETPGPDDQTPGGADSSVLYVVLGVAAAVAIALPIGFVVLRRRAAAQVPEPGIIVQTDDDVNAGPGYQPEAAEPAPVAPPAAHHGPQPPPARHGPQPPQHGPSKGPRGPHPPN